jgi:predicted NBD/HSP70 family sugar kinase
MNPALLALDFGGTKLTAATWQREGAEGKGFTRVASVLSPPTSDATADRELMLEICDEVLAGGAPAAVGVSFGGLVQHKQGKAVRHSCMSLSVLGLAAGGSLEGRSIMDGMALLERSDTCRF